MIAPRHILVPTDMSQFSLSVLQYAEEIAEIFKAHVTVLHVVEHEERHREGRTRWTDADVEARARSMITDLMIDTDLSPNEMKIVIRHGHAAAEIASAAKTLNADLIVMSTHGRTGLRHVLVGSVAERVVRIAQCPVLTMRPEAFREIVAITEDDIAGDLHLGSDSA